MIRSVVAALIFACLASPIIADYFHVSTEPPKGWSVEEIEKKRFPSVSYTPPKGRDAWFSIKEFGQVGDVIHKNKTLAEIHDWFLETFEKEEFGAHKSEKFRTTHGSYLISTFEDPALKGKPIVFEDYKYAIYFTGIVGGRHVVSCVLLSQQKEGVDLEDAKAAIMKLKLK